MCVPVTTAPNGCPSPIPAPFLQDKGHVLPEPDMLISAIGTRIYTK